MHNRNGHAATMLRARQPGATAAALSAACGRAEVVGIKPWKRWQIDPFLRRRYGELHYSTSPQAALRRQAQRGGAIVIWAAREPDDFAEAARAQGAALVRIEDGFLRSVGLGSNHFGGASLVVDPEGIYFDPRTPSALEQLLQTGEFDAPLLARAAGLREFLVRHGLTKYNVGTRHHPPLGGRPGQARILVPGQVENDASIRCGAPATRSNLELLRGVREAEPDAWIIYKPHPDIEAGTRPGQVEEAQALHFADQVVNSVCAGSILPYVDAVHTLTSLLGFEALLRGLPVTVWGLPFYAGWGLTDDKITLPRRTRRLNLDELVAGTLILYPLYADTETGLPCEVEQVAAALAANRHETRGGNNRVLRIARLCRGLFRSWTSARASR